jgi:hypothetical protein
VDRSPLSSRTRRAALPVLLVVTVLGLAGCRPFAPDPPPPRPPDTPPVGPDVPLPPPEPPPRPRGGTEPPAGAPELSPAGDDLLRESERNEIAREIVCFTYDNFYDPATGEVGLPPQDEFVQSVVGTLAPDGSQLLYTAKAVELYGTLSSLQQGDLGAVAIDVFCV